MSNRLDEILEEIRELEKNVKEEIQRKEKEFQYKITKGKIVFEEEIARLHKKFSKKLLYYLFGSRLLNMLTAPVIYIIIVPAALLDLGITIYQAICFPAYGIPKVRRKKHFIFDRHYLKYLNVLEKLNCLYCGYFNGLMTYSSEIAARTEQYWCPIKHAIGPARFHSRYHLFFDYGDAEAYRTRLAEIRKRYEDVE